MGLFNKFRKKFPAGQTAEALAEKKDLTLAELKAKAETKTVSGSKAAKKVAKEDTRMAYRHLIRPMVTEKGAYLASSGKYLFEVGPKSNKVEIKKAIRAVYGVNPTKVNIVNLPGKKIRYGKVSGLTKKTRKAVVTLKRGESIEVYEGV